MVGWKRSVHLEELLLNGTMYTVLCRHMVNDGKLRRAWITTNPEEVTCKQCLARMKERGIK